MSEQGQEYQFSLACRADIETLLTIEREAVSFPWTIKNYASCFTARHEIWLLTNEMADVLGFSILFFIGPEIELLNLCVRKSKQRRGMGRRLLAHSIERCREKSGETLFLELRESNSAAFSLYQSLGFNETGRRSNYYPTERGREDALLMALELGDSLEVIS